MELETTITAKFIMKDATPEMQRNIDAMNTHAEDCANRLQNTFRGLIVEMMDMKRQQFSTPREDVEAEEGTDA